MRGGILASRIVAVSLLSVVAAGCSGGGNPSGPSGSGNVVTVVVDPARDTVEVGVQIQFRARPLDSRGRELQGRQVPTWSSSNPAVAAVDPNLPAGQGNPILVRAVSAGHARITAVTEGISGHAELDVEVPANARTVTGQVFDGVTQQGIANASVSLECCGIPGDLGITTTAADGSFSATIPNIQFTGGITARVEAAGYVSAAAFVDVPFSSGNDTAIVPPIPLVPQSGSPGGILGTVRNARDNQPISGATVRLQAGVISGGPVTPLRATVSDAAGVYSFTSLSAGTYSVSAVLFPQFADGSRTAIAVGNNGVTPDQDVVLSPRGGQDIRIVLTWGASPADLDAHLTGPAPGGRFHVYFPPGSRGDLTASPFAALDVDDVSSFGPETITITTTSDGPYRYSVHDFTNRNSDDSTALSNSRARVEFYDSVGLRRTFFVPPGRVGTLWTVFEMQGSEPFQITDVNTIQNTQDPAAVQNRSPALPAAQRGTDADLIGAALRALSKTP